MTASRHFLIHTGVLTSNGTQISNDWKLTHMTGIWVIASQDPDSLRTRHGVPVPEAAKADTTNDYLWKMCRIG